MVGRLQERLELGHLVLSAVDLDHLAVNTFAAPACSTAPIVSSAEPYDELGLGIGAESRIWRSESRLLSVSNAAALPHYTALLHNNALPWAKANVTPQAQIISDYVEKSMRTLAGVDTRRFEARFGVPFEYYYPGLARVLTDCGFVEQNGFSIRLSERGRVVADNVVSNFKLDPAEFEPIASARPEALLKVEMPELLAQHS